MVDQTGTYVYYLGGGMTSKEEFEDLFKAILDEERVPGMLVEVDSSSVSKSTDSSASSTLGSYDITVAYDVSEVPQDFLNRLAGAGLLPPDNFFDAEGIPDLKMLYEENIPLMQATLEALQADGKATVPNLVGVDDVKAGRFAYCGEDGNITDLTLSSDGMLSISSDGPIPPNDIFFFNDALTLYGNQVEFDKIIVEDRVIGTVYYYTG